MPFWHRVCTYSMWSADVGCRGTLPPCILICLPTFISVGRWVHVPGSSNWKPCGAGSLFADANAAIIHQLGGGARRSPVSSVTHSSLMCSLQYSAAEQSFNTHSVASACSLQPSPTSSVWRPEGRGAPSCLSNHRDSWTQSRLAFIVQSPTPLAYFPKHSIGLNDDL